MPTVHSHYENLKVARDASPDAIRAAYRLLTRQHHPDRNPDSRDAQRIMSVINVAYDVLSDPRRRLEHDLWIAQAEARPAPASTKGRPTLHVPAPDQQQKHAWSAEEAAERRVRQQRLDKRMRNLVRHLTRYGVGYGAALLGLGWWFVASGPTLPGLRQITAGTLSQTRDPVPGYARARAAPNGQPWPVGSGYVAGYQRLNESGLSQIVVDNSRNDMDMFAKLVSLDGPTAYPVRTVFVAARGQLTLDKLNIGTYDLRYRNLATGSLFRTPAFILEEVHTSGGTQHSVATLRLYQATDGNLQTYALGEAEFF
jgi:DnaJ domain